MLQQRRPPARYGFPAAAPDRAPRFLFYTNECVGLGHLRRTMGLARAVTARDPAAHALVITGSDGASGYAPEPRIETVKLPALARDADGVHRPRHLGVTPDQLGRLRSQIALAAAESFTPSVAVVDKTPLGLRDELLPTLDLLSRSRGCARVLGLRDVEDDPSIVRERWTAARMRDAICRLYDAVLVYGTDSTLDAIDCMGWGELPIPVHHVGYVGAPLPARAPADVPEDYVLVTVGGGADGYELLATVVEALRARPLGCPVVMVTGPLMPEDRVAALRERAGTAVDRIESSRPDLDALIVGARAVVTMAGYNTVSELFRAGKPALLVPRVLPSSEQLIRATTFAAAGMAEMLHPDDLTPATMRAALDRLLTREPPAVDPSQYGGAATAAEILCDLAEERSAGVPRARMSVA